MAQGIFLGIISQFLFGLLYLFSLWLQPLNGTDVFAWRMVMMVFGLFLIIFPTVGCRSLSKLVNETLGKDKKRLDVVFARHAQCRQSILVIYVGAS